MRAEVEARKQIGWNRHGNFVLEVRVQRTARSHSPSSQPSAPAPQVFGYERPTMMILEAAKMTLRVQLNKDHSGNVAFATLCIHQVLEGLSELHKYGVVHMDIKPENIFLLDRRDRAPVRARPKLRARASRPERTATTITAGRCGSSAISTPTAKRGRPSAATPPSTRRPRWPRPCSPVQRS